MRQVSLVISLIQVVCAAHCIEVELICTHLSFNNRGVYVADTTNVVVIIYKYQIAVYLVLRARCKP